MECDFARTSLPGKPVSLELKTVYHLQADKTYIVKRTDTGRTGFVALRTFQGYGEVSIEGFPRLKTGPDTLLIFENVLVRDYYCSDDCWVFWWFEFNCSEVNDFPLNQVINLDMVSRELDDCKMCMDMLKVNNKISNCVASVTMSTLYYKWLMQYQSATMVYKPYSTAIQKTILRMKSDMQRPLSVEDMAKMNALSVRRFRQVFEVVTGCKPKEYYDSLRV